MRRTSGQAVHMAVDDLHMKDILTKKRIPLKKERLAVQCLQSCTGGSKVLSSWPLLTDTGGLRWFYTKGYQVYGQDKLGFSQIYTLL